MKRLPVITTILAVIVMAVVVGCDDSSTEPSKPKLTGTVLLADSTDHSGITIAIYEVPEAGALENIQQEHPGIGAPLAYPRFDHRFATPVATGETKANGEFSIGVSKGDYIVVAYKAGFGFRYIYNQTTNSRNDWPANIVLYPEVELSGLLGDGYVFETDRHYVITDDLWLTGTMFYNFQPGAWIRIAPTASINITAPVSLLGSASYPYHITCNDGLDTFTHSANPLDMGRYNQFNLTADAAPQGTTIEGACFSLGQKGLNVSVNNLSFIDSVVEYCTNGVVFSNLAQAFCLNLTIVDNSRSGSTGLSYEMITEGEIDHCIFLNNDAGVRVQNHYMGTMEDNMFQGNNTGMEWNQSAGEINNNEFSGNSSRDLYFSMNLNETTEDLEIHDNLFKSSTSVASRELNPNYVFSPVHINYNEFYSLQWFIKLHPDQYWDDKTIDATDNYFAGEDTESDIKLKVYDNQDDTLYPTPPATDVTGFRTSPFSNRDIGIRD